MNRISPSQQPSLPWTGLFLTSQGQGPHRRSRTRRQSLRFALHGLRDAWRTQPNFRLQVYAASGVIAAGLWLHLSMTEWLWISFAIGLVLFAELMNTAIEQTVDLVVGLRPDPLARSVKDLAAGCVLVASLLAVAIGGFTFLSHVLRG